MPIEEDAAAKLAANQALTEVLAEHVNLYGRRKVALEQEIAMLRDAKGLADTSKLIVQRNLDLKRNAIAAEQQILEKIQEQRVEYQRLVASGQDDERTKSRILELESRIGSLRPKEIKDRFESLSVAKQLLATSENTISATQRAVRTTLGISDAWKKSLIGSMAFGGKLEDITAGLQSTVNLSNTIMSTWMKVAEVSMKSALEYDRMAASVRQISGDTGINDLAQRTYQAHRSMLQFGVSVQDAGEATQSLYSGMASFSHLIPAQQDALRRQSALLKEVGVDSQTTAQMLNFMDKGLKMSTSDSVALTNKLFGLAKALKVPPGAIFRDWQAASSELAKYGNNMNEVFSGLAMQAKNTGLSINQLISVTKQFDQFDQAGAAVGRLNAILGGPYLNAIEMVYMKEHQRVQVMRDSLAASGMVYSELSRHERLLIANAAGIRDMAQAAMFFGGTQRQFKTAVANQKALEERAKMSQAAMDKLKNAAMGLAIALTPLVDGVSRLADGLAYLTSHPIGKWLGSILFVLGPLTMKFLAWRRATAISNTMLAAANVIINQHTGAVGRDAVALHAVSGAQGRWTAQLQRHNFVMQAGLAPAGQSIGMIRNIRVAADGSIGSVRGMGAAFAQTRGFLTAFVVAGTATYWLLGKLKNQWANATGALLGFAMATAALKMARSGWNPAALAVGGAGLAIFSSSALSAVNMAKHAKFGADEPGLYVAGEESRELVDMRGGGSITPSNETETLLGGAEWLTMMGEVKEAITNLSMRLDNVGQGRGGPQQPIVIELNGDVVGEFAVGKVNEALGLQV